jgi:hypothetical protein
MIMIIIIIITTMAVMALKDDGLLHGGFAMHMLDLWKPPRIWNRSGRWNVIVGGC